MEVWTIKKIARLIMQEPCSTTGKVVLQDEILPDEPVGQRVRFHKTIPPPRQLSGTALTGGSLLLIADSIFPIVPIRQLVGSKNNFSA